MSAELERPKVADRTMTRLRRAILAGEFKPGQDLPPERELAQAYGVSRLTLRAALARLQNEGLVRPVHGSGTRVLDFRTTGGLELLGPLTTLAIEANHLPTSLLAQILEMRRVLAVAAFGLATERATEPELEELRVTLTWLSSRTGDARDFMEGDLKFARTLIDAAHNLPLQLLYNTVARTLWSQPGMEQLFAINDSTATLHVYGKLVDLMQARKVAQVRKMAGRLMQRQDRLLLRSLRELEQALGPAADEPEGRQESGAQTPASSGVKP